MATVSITQRGKHSFRLRTKYKDPQTGNWAEHAFTVRGTRDYAEAQKRLLLDSFAVGKIERLTSETVRGYLENWVEHRLALGAIRQTTATTYRVMFRDFNARFGDDMLVSVKAEAVRLWLKDTTVSKSAYNARYSARVLKCAFKDAVKEGVLPFNVFDKIEMPRVKTERKEIDISHDQLKALWDEGCLIVRLALETGMRRGELAGLQWRDVSEDGAVVHVRRTVVVSARRVYINEPKTAAGRRKIRVTPAMAEQLRKARNNPYEYVHGGRAEPLHPGVVSRLLEKALEAAGLDDMSGHAFRHAHATHLLRNGASVAAVSKRLGHAKITTTMSTYAHAIEEDDSEIIEVIGSVLRQAQPASQAN